MRGKFAGIFENRIRNLQATLKETSVQPQSERDNNRRRQWEQVAKRGQVGFYGHFAVCKRFIFIGDFISISKKTKRCM